MAASGTEDEAIKLDITALSGDADGGAETLTVVLRGVPDGFSFADGTGAAVGTQVEPGSWRIDVEQLDDLYFVRPTHYSGEVTLSVEVTAREVTNHETTVTTPLPITVAPVADVLTIQSTVTGNEDSFGGAIAVPLTIGLVDTDGSESLTDTIKITFDTDDQTAGVLQWSDGTALSASVDPVTGALTYEIDVATALDSGALTFDAGTQTYSVSGLVFVPTDDLDKDITFDVSATVIDAGASTRTTAGTGSITVEAVADATLLTGYDTGVMEHDAGAAGTDGWTRVGISALGLGDTDESETLTLYVEVPNGATLGYGSDGQAAGPAIATVPGNSVTLTQSSTGATATVGGGAATLYAIQIPAAQIDFVRDNLMVRPVDGSSADLSIKLTAVATDTDRPEGVEQAWSSTTVHVDVGVEAPEVTGNTALTGNEGGDWIALTGLVAEVQAPSGATPAEETVTVTFEGLPAGVEIGFGDAQIAVGGSGAIDVTDYWNATTGAIEGLQIRWISPDASGDINFTVKAVVKDVDATTPGGDLDAEGSVPNATTGDGMPDVASAIASVSVTVTPVVDGWSVTAVTQGKEDSKTYDGAAAPIVVAPVITKSADGDETLTGTVVFDFNHGANDAAAGTLTWQGDAGLFVTNGDGTYSLKAEAFVVNPDGTMTVDASKGQLVYEPRENFDNNDTAVDYKLTFTVDDKGVTKSFSGTGTIDVEAIADVVDITSGGSGFEDSKDGPISVDLAIALRDTDGSETLTGKVEIVFDAADLAAGTLTWGADGSEVTYREEGDKRIYEVPADSAAVTATATGYAVAGLVFKPTADSDADVTYEVRATVLDNDGSTRTSEGTGTITVTAVADAPTITLPTAKDAMEGTDGAREITLDLTTGLEDTDGSETLFVYVTLEDQSAATVLMRGSETLTPVGSDVTGPDGAVLPGGSTYVFQIDSNTQLADVLGGLKAVLPAGDSKDFFVHVNAKTVEDDPDGAPREAWGEGKTTRVDIGTSAPVLTATGATAVIAETTAHTQDTDGTVLNLNSFITVTQPHSDGTETVVVELSGIPSTVTVEIKGADGSWSTVTPSGGVLTIPQDALSEVRFTTETGDDANFEVQARAVVTDADWSDATLKTAPGDALYDDAPDSAKSEAVTFGVTVQGRADEADLSASGIGYEETPFKLTLDIAATDDSESVTGVVLTGLPEGSVLTITGADGNPTWTTTVGADGTADLSGRDLGDLKDNLTLTTPKDYSTKGGELPLQLQVTTTENGAESGAGEVDATASTHTTTHDFAVKVFGYADDPDVNITDDKQILNEDTFYKLATAGKFSGTGGETTGDGSEKITYEITSSDPNARLYFRTSGAPSASSYPTGTAKDNNGDGLYENNGFINKVGGKWLVDSSQIDKIYAGGSQNWSGELTFTVKIVATEVDAADSYPIDGPRGTASDTDTLTLTIDPQADKLTISGSHTTEEDTALNFSPAIKLQDTDGSETLVDSVYLVVSGSSAAAMMDGTLTLGGTEYHAFTATVSGSNVVTPVPEGTPGAVWVYELPSSGFNYNSGTKTYTAPLTFTPGEDNSNDITYKVIATVQDGVDGPKLPTAFNTAKITVNAVADAPDVTITAATDPVSGAVLGKENAWTSLGIDAAPTDADNTEDLVSAELKGVPDGWMVGYGSDSDLASKSADGTWVLDVSRLDDVMIKPPRDWYGESPTLKLTVVSQEDGSDGASASGKATASTTVDVKVDIEAVAQTPNLTVRSVQTTEETAVALDIAGQITDIDTQVGRTASEYLEFYIENVDHGTLVDGAGAAVGERGALVGGVWVADPAGSTVKLTPAELDGLKFQPAEDYSGTVNLNVIARAVDDNGTSTADRSAPLNIVVKGVVDDLQGPATLREVSEDAGWFDAGLGGYTTKDAVGVDADGSEKISAVIHKPAGLSIQLNGIADADDVLRYVGKDAAGNELWAVDPGYLDTVQFKLPGNWASNDPFPVTVDIVVTESDGASKTFPQVITIDVDAVADKPKVGLSSSHNEDSHIVGGVDQGIALDLSGAVTDATGGVENVTGFALRLNVGASDLPSGTVLTLEIDGVTYTLGTGADTFNGAGYDIVITDPDLVAQLAGGGGLPGTLYGVPEHWSKDIRLDLVAESTDINGSKAYSDVATLKVELKAVADTAETFDLDTAVSGANGAQIDLGLDVALKDLDGSETGYLVVTGGVDGIILEARDGNGNPVTVHNAGNGRWIVTKAEGVELFAKGENAEASLDVKLVIVDTDPDSGAISTSEETKAIDVTIGSPGSGGGGTPPAPPTVEVTLAAGSTPEDTTVTATAKVTPVDGATATAVVIDIASLPAGTKLLTAHYEVDGAYIVPVGADGSVQLSFTPPQDYAGSLTIEATGVAQSGYVTSESTPVTAEATITPVTELGTGAIKAAIASGADTTEDTDGVAFTVTVTQQDKDASERIVGGTAGTAHMVIMAAAVIPNGTVLKFDSSEWTWDGTVWRDESGTAGDPEIPLDDTSAFNAVDGSISVGGLSVKPPENWHGDIQLKIAVDVQDGTATPATWVGEIKIPISAENDLNAVVAADVVGTEDVATPLAITIDTDDIKGVHTHGSEIVSVVIRNVPAGMVIVGASNNGDDGTGKTSWTVDASVVKGMGADGSLSGLKLQTPQDWAGEVSLEVEVFQREPSTGEIKTVTDSFTVDVQGVADTPSVNPQDVEGFERQAVALDLRAFSGDLDQVNGAETVTVTVTGVPAGAYFTYTVTDGDGVVTTVTVEPDADGTVTLPVTGADGHSFVGPEYASGEYTMSVTATATEGGTTAVGDAMSFKVTLTGVANAPNLAAPTAVTGDEDGTIALNITGSLKDTDGSETLQFLLDVSGDGVDPSKIQMVAADGTIYSASPTDGLFHIPADQITGLGLKPEGDWSGEITVDVIARATEEDGGPQGTADTTTSITVTVNPVDDAPTIDISSSYGVQGTTPMVVHALDQSGPDSAISFADVDYTDAADARLGGLRISLGGTTGAGDALGLTGLPVTVAADGTATVVIGGATFAIVASDDGRTIAIAGEGTYEQYQQLADAVILTNPADQLAPGQRDITFTAVDADDEDLVGADTAQVAIGEQGVVLDRQDGDVIFGAGGSATVVGVEPLSVADSDTLAALFDDLTEAQEAMLAAMSIALLGGREEGDTLGITGQDVRFNVLDGKLEVRVPSADPDGEPTVVQVSYATATDAGGEVTHTLTFSGDADADVYRELAGSVILTSADGTVSAGERTFEITLKDADGETIGESETTTVAVDSEITQEDEARGNLFFTSGDTATITGTDGDDLFVYGVGGADVMPDLVSIDGGSGADTLVMMDSGGVEGDWLFQVESDAPPAEDPTEGTGGLVYDVTVEEGNATVSDGGHTVDLEPADGGTEVAATITFDDHKTVETHDVEQILT
ncbi:MAG: hypothetical protein LDL44_01470 [Caenispirillum sp.]|nr:hypothetical protein [Caenispirillum sp.]